MVIVKTTAFVSLINIFEPVKLFTFLFAVYMLCLSCIPCNDKDENFSGITSNILHEKKNHAEKESCTPLCICSCCGQISIINPEAQKFTVEQTSIFQLKHSGYNGLFLPSQCLESIWQPPRLSLKFI
jgi:uncharacterized protein DUF6660